MYQENRKSLNWFVGCGHDCIYCKPSFQRQMKRQLHNCKQCYAYEPHAHLERLLKPPPKTEGDEFIFFPSSGDVAFAKACDIEVAFDYARKYFDRTFLTQTKDPIKLLYYRFPPNVMLGTTIETNRVEFNTPSHFRNYEEISKAPFPFFRYDAMLYHTLRHNIRQIVTLEPVLDFNMVVIIKWIKTIDPEAVYIGYDNHHCKLPEPTLEKTRKLIAQLEQFTEVRVKSLRKAWYEE